MGSSDLFPEKFAMYFGTMSPLASKIYSDIEGIEDYIKAHGPPSITYSEKCTIVDKFLIYDHLPKNDANGKLNKRLSEYQKYQLNKSETSLNCMLDNNDVIISEAELIQPVFYNDATLDQDHESVLLTSVAPKKPEKLVYDENNYWTDEHSVPYSSCTQTQAKACKLQQFLDSLPPPPQHPHRRHDHPLKYRAPPIPTAKSSVRVVQVQDDEDEDDEDYIIRPSAKSHDDQEYADRYSKIDKLNSGNKSSSNKYPVGVSVFGGAFGDGPPAPQRKNSSADVGNKEEDLPNQVQNKDLIAELQAKLKKGKPPPSEGSESDGGMSGNTVRASMKLHKPKAPPPPPPVNFKPPGGAVKVKEDKNTKKSKKEKEKRQESSSPKMPGREISDEFVVDVSSPCKTVTTKTGLDFLDNW